MGLGPTELIILLVIALVFFGPSRLPGLGKSMGEAIRGFKKGMEGIDEEEEKVKREQISSNETSTTTTQDKQKDKV